jgi:PD-(D/E)XK nuclease superfamily
MNATALDPGFIFSQHSLTDFNDCPRRFFLRYIRKQAWPLLEVAPLGMDALTYREYLRKGAQLHQWIERYWLGVPSPESVVPSVDSTSFLGTRDAELSVWWSRFLATDFSSLPPQRVPELELVAPLGEFRLYARFDLLASGGAGQPLTIVDWKTLRGERAPGYDFLKQRVQTRVYLYVLATAGEPYATDVRADHGLDAGSCEMRYWLANFPEQPWVEIGYSPAEYRADYERLLALARDIASRPDESAFEKTADERHCAVCTYRTLCHRGSAGGLDMPVADAEARVIDLSDVQELEY